MRFVLTNLKIKLNVNGSLKFEVNNTAWSLFLWNEKGVESLIVETHFSQDIFATLQSLQHCILKRLNSKDNKVENNF